MKKRLLALAVALLVGASLFAAENKSTPKLEPIMAPGTIAVNVGLGSGFFWGLDIGGGVEYVFTRVNIADTVPITFGAAARASYMNWYGYSGFSAGGLVTGHFGLAALSLPEGLAWLGNTDIYVGLGLGFHSWSDYYTSGMHFASIDGVNYFFTKKIALNLEYNYYGWSGGYIGVLFKL